MDALFSVGVSALLYLYKAVDIERIANGKFFMASNSCAGGGGM